MSDNENEFRAALNALMTRIHSGAQQQRPIDAWALYGETPTWGAYTTEGNMVAAPNPGAPETSAQTLQSETVADPSAAPVTEEPVQKSLVDLTVAAAPQGVVADWSASEATLAPDTLAKAMEYLTRASVSQGLAKAAPPEGFARCNTCGTENKLELGGSYPGCSECGHMVHHKSGCRCAQCVSDGEIEANSRTQQG